MNPIPTQKSSGESDGVCFDILAIILPRRNSEPIEATAEASHA